MLAEVTAAEVTPVIIDQYCLEQTSERPARERRGPFCYYAVSGTSSRRGTCPRLPEPYSSALTSAKPSMAPSFESRPRSKPTGASERLGLRNVPKMMSHNGRSAKL